MPHLQKSAFMICLCLEFLVFISRRLSHRQHNTFLSFFFLLPGCFRLLMRLKKWVVKLLFFLIIYIKNSTSVAGELEAYYIAPLSKMLIEDTKASSNRRIHLYQFVMYVKIILYFLDDVLIFRNT